jgi:hypothetical protein
MKSTLIDLIFDTLTHSNYANLSVEDKDDFYKRVKAIHEQEMQSQYNLGLGIGKSEGIKQAMNLLNK